MSTRLTLLLLSAEERWNLPSDVHTTMAIGSALEVLAGKDGCETLCIDPGSPGRAPRSKDSTRFNGKLRDECLADVFITHAAVKRRATIGM